MRAPLTGSVQKWEAMTPNTSMSRVIRAAIPRFGRRWRIFLAGGLMLAGVGLPATVNAEPIYTPGPTPPAQLPPPPPSPFESGMRGFGTGLAAGVAGGYLFARQDGFTSSDWRPIVAGAGVGAVAGGLTGFALGVVDSNSVIPGRGFLVLRSTAYGGMFGAVTGGIIGGLAALSTDKPEHILLGAAIGTLSGTVVGVVLGAIEPNPWAPGGRHGLSFGVSPYSTGNGSLAYGPTLSGRF
jgi:hypothetical protein